MRRSHRDQGAILGIIAAIVIVVILIGAGVVLFLLPLRGVDVNEVRTTTSSGATSLVFDLTVDAGDVQVRFVDSSTAATLHVSGQQRTGLLWSSQPANVTWDESMSGTELRVNATVHMGRPMMMFTTNIGCTLDISRQLMTTLDVENSFGQIGVNASNGTSLGGMMLKASLGKIDVRLGNGTILSGPLAAETSLGALDLRWDGVSSIAGANVSLKTSAGALTADIAQNRSLPGNVNLDMTSSLGSVDLTLRIKGDTSAHIASNAQVGKVDIKERTGFNGNDTELMSTNYQQPSNFEVSCKASAGSVNVRAMYEA